MAPADTNLTRSASPTEQALPWAPLMALIYAFGLSQAYRSVTAMMAAGLVHDFALSAQGLGVFAATFAFSFGLSQFVMGIALDFYGLRRTWLWTFPLAILGAGVSALAPNFGVLLLGQALLGIGCSPAFVVCTLFIARRFPVHRFAAVSGLAMGVGGLGLLLTGTPLAWLIDVSSWRVGFGVLTGLSCAAWWWVYLRMHEGLTDTDRRPQSLTHALRGFAALLLLPQTWGILALSMVSYASFLTLRGLWLGPLLMDRHQWSLVQTGNVALLVSVLSMFSPAVFGHWDPGPARRRPWIVYTALGMASIFVLMAFIPTPWVDVGGMVALALICGANILQYANVRASYTADMSGRAMSVFTMAMFLGVALVQSLSGFAATWSNTRGLDPYMGVLVCVASLLVLGAMAFRFSPAGREPAKNEN
jgi:predicted MFS family arabinose efflux permease